MDLNSTMRNDPCVQPSIGVSTHEAGKGVSPSVAAESDVSSNSPKNPSVIWSSSSGIPEKLRRSDTARTQKILDSGGSWTYEVISLLIAVGALIAMIVLLAEYDGHPLPEWPHKITFNAMIALLATIITATLAVPLSNGISQLKWNRFFTRSAPLADMEVFDEASRGSWGAFMMLVKLRGGYMGTFGAIVVILVLALNPFSQQVATYQNRMIAAPKTATNLRSTGYELALESATSDQGFIPILPLKAAVYNGLFAEDGKPLLKLPVNCGTGNCTWEHFESLGVCNECTDMTELMTRYCQDSNDGGDDDDCGWSLPSGAVLNNSAEVFSMHSIFPSTLGDMSYGTIMDLVFMGTEAQDNSAGSLIPWARQCSLTACVQTINSTVENGQLKEEVISTATNDSVPTQEADSLQPVMITGSDHHTEYPISMEALLGFRSWFSELFVNGSASRNSAFINKTISSGENIVVNLTVGISEGETFFDNDIVQAFYWNYYEYPEGIDLLMDDLAVSMSVSFRSTASENVTGSSLYEQSFVHVQWGFLVVPLLSVLFTAVFLIVVIWRTHSTKSKLWKSSILATLMHGLDHDIKERLEALEELRLQQKEAKNVRVQLLGGNNDEKMRLLRATENVAC